MRKSRRHNVGAGSFPNAGRRGYAHLVGTPVERTVIGVQRRAVAYCVDDLAAVDAFEVDTCNAEIRVPKLPLDDDQWCALASHLDRMRMAELMRSEAAADGG